MSGTKAYKIKNTIAKRLFSVFYTENAELNIAGYFLFLAFITLYIYYIMFSKSTVLNSKHTKTSARYESFYLAFFSSSNRTKLLPYFERGLKLSKCATQKITKVTSLYF